MFDHLEPSPVAIVPLADMAKQLEDREKFVIAGLVSTAGTVVYGQPKVGKSVLITQLAYALANGRPFLGVEPTREWTVAVALTDAGAWGEFCDNYAALDNTWRNLVAVTNPRGGDLEESAVHAEILIVDNLDGLLPADADLNSRHTVKPTLERLTGLVVEQSMPVVLVHHAAKPGMGRGKTLNGTQFITSWPRMILHLEANGKGAGTHRLTVSGNHTRETVYRLSLEDADGLRFNVAQAGEVRQKQERARDAATLNKHLSMAGWVVANCQGLSQNKAAEKLVAEFGGNANTYRSYLGSGKIPVVRSGADWRLTEAAQERLAD
jgi:hypothetical protein